MTAAKTFYNWKLGDGELISFWHDTWVGDCSLKVQFWDLFSICNQANCTISQVWDGTNLKLWFRRCVDRASMALW